MELYCNSNFRKFCWVIRTQPISLLKLFLLYGEFTDEKKKELLDRITKRYEEQTSPYYAAARLWVDGIIDPLDTRMIISTGIDMASHEQNVKPYNVGVIQT